MSEPFLPDPAETAEEAPETGAEEFAEVEDDPQPDVLAGGADDEGDDEDDPAAADPSAAGPLGTGQDDFRTPEAGDRLDDAELAADLRTE